VRALRQGNGLLRPWLQVGRASAKKTPLQGSEIRQPAE